MIINYDKYRDPHQRLYFKILWPSLSFTMPQLMNKSNHMIWSQKSTPIESTCIDYQQMFIPYKGSGGIINIPFSGISISQNSRSMIDGNSNSGHFFYSIGMIERWNGGIPGPFVNDLIHSKNIVNHVELYLLDYKNYDKRMTEQKVMDLKAELFQWKTELMKLNGGEPFNLTTMKFEYVTDELREERDALKIELEATRHDIRVLSMTEDQMRGIINRQQKHIEMNEDELEGMKEIMDGWQDEVMLSKRDCMMIIGFIGLLLFVLIIVSCCCMINKNKNKIDINERARNIYRSGYPKSILR